MNDLVHVLKLIHHLIDLENFLKARGDNTAEIHTTITGSGGLALSRFLDVPFEQEVITCSKAVETFIPETNVAIELGGEDAKITFFGTVFL